MRSHIGWRGERNIAYKGVETSPYQTRFKTVRLMTIRNGLSRQYLLAVGLGCYKIVILMIRNRPKRTIFGSGGVRRLQMVLELDSGWCANEEVGSPRGRL